MRIYKLIKIAVLISEIYRLIDSLNFTKKNESKTKKNQHNLVKILKITWLLRSINFFIASYIFKKKNTSNNSISNFLSSCISNIFNNRMVIILVVTALYSSVTLGSAKKLPIPRFASIKANEVNARNGPAIKSPIEWIFIKKGEPVEIIAEYDQWRQIRDIRGEGGWVHSSVLSGKRSIIIVGDKVINLYKNSQAKEVIAHLHPEVRCQLQKCKEEWCKVQCNLQIGWLLKEQIWGIYTNEQL